MRTQSQGFLGRSLEIVSCHLSQALEPAANTALKVSIYNMLLLPQSSKDGLLGFCISTSDFVSVFHLNHIVLYDSARGEMRQLDSLHCFQMFPLPLVQRTSFLKFILFHTTVFELQNSHQCKGETTNPQNQASSCPIDTPLPQVDASILFGSSL